MVRSAVVIGFDHHVSAFCSNVNRFCKSWRFRGYPKTPLGLVRALISLFSANVLIAFGGPAPHRLLVEIARLLRIPVFVIWVGTDVTNALEMPLTMTHVLRAGFVHIAIAPWLIEELSRIGIKAEYVGVIGINPSDELPIQRGRLRAVTYLPEPRRDFYGRKHVYEVARRLSDIDFLCLGPGTPDPEAPPNVTFLGWVSDIDKQLEKAAVLLRVPEHDGMSLFVLEALGKGRHVAWKYPIPGVELVKTPEDTVSYLRWLQSRQEAGTLDINRLGKAYITSNYDAQKTAQGFVGFLERNLLKLESPKRKKYKVAISGLDLFAIDVANINDQLQSDWQVEVLQFQTRYDLVRSLFSLASSDVWYTIGTASVSPVMKWTSKLFHKPRIMHWVGSDIETARRNSTVLQAVKSQEIRHLAEVEWTLDELAAMGITAAIAPLPPRILHDPIPKLPATFTLLLYIPRSRMEFYGKLMFEKLVEKYKDEDINFIVVGGGGVNVSTDARVRNLGWRYSLEDVYAQSSALLRFTSHDGLSLMVLEALSLGRYVLWSKEFDYVTHVTGFDSIVSAIERLLLLHRTRALAPQEDAAFFVRSRYNRHRCVRDIIAQWHAATEPKLKGSEILANLDSEATP